MRKHPSIEIVGNVKTEIKNLFKSLERFKEERIFHISKKPSEILGKLETKIAKLGKLRGKLTYASVYSNPYVPDYRDGLEWHIDGDYNKKELSDFVITTYPTQTQFLLVEPQYYKWYIKNLKDHDHEFEPELESMIKKWLEQRKAKIFTPKIGDVVLAKNFAIHRVNPKAEDKRRLCCRVWKD